MKYYEYGVRTSESGGFVGKFGEKSNTNWEHVMNDLSMLGTTGWEVYHVIEKNNVIHFLLRREIPSDVAEEKYMSKGEKMLGFVDHVGPDSETWNS